MTLCNSNALNSLDDINLIGGDYKEILVHVNDIDHGGLINVENISATFALIEYNNRYSQIPLLQKDLERVDGDNYSLKLILETNDTLELSGKFIYQFTVSIPSSTGQINQTTKVESFQGIMRIDRNIIGR